MLDDLLFFEKLTNGPLANAVLCGALAGPTWFWADSCCWGEDPAMAQVRPTKTLAAGRLLMDLRRSLSRLTGSMLSRELPLPIGADFASTLSNISNRFGNSDATVMDTPVTLPG